MYKRVCFFVHKKHELLPFWSYVKVFKTFAECIQGNIVNEENVEAKVDNCDIIIGDDWDAIKLSSLLGPSNKKKIIPYAQTLYGLNTLRSGNKGIKRTVGSFLPLHFIAKDYVSKMRSFTAIFANSIGTASLLHHLYNLYPTYVLHPAVNQFIYKPVVKKEDKILIFGSSPYLDGIVDPIDLKVVTSIIEEAKKRNLEVHAFGRKLEFGHKIINHEFISEDELVKLYSSSLITFTPQPLELFGLVPIESASCGTPFISTYFHDALLPGVNGYVFHPKHISTQFDLALNLNRYEIVQSVAQYTTNKICRLLTNYIEEVSLMSTQEM